MFDRLRETKAVAPRSKFLVLREDTGDAIGRPSHALLIENERSQHGPLYAKLGSDGRYHPVSKETAVRMREEGNRDVHSVIIQHGEDATATNTELAPHATEDSSNVETLRDATLAGFYSAAVRAQEAALEMGDKFLRQAAVRRAKIYRDEIRRRSTVFAERSDQDGLDRLNAALRGLSVAEIRAERGE